MSKREAARPVLELQRELGLLSAAEVDEVSRLLSPRSPVETALRMSDTIHLHVRVDDVASMPHDQLRGAGGEVENQRDGYVKFAFRGGVNMIFSSIDVAEDDRLPASARRPRPHLDHVGLDLRGETAAVRAAFDGNARQLREQGWRHVGQGGGDRPVFCCHTSVREKHWLYPPAAAGLACAIELAFGPLQIHAGKMGCDLRPIDPAHPLAAQAVCGSHAAHGDAHAGATTSAHYYERADLARFAAVGEHAPQAWSSFMAWYERATGTDSALSRRDKALIALAVAHSKQCPYCIDAYTQTCAKLGIGVEQMHEAVHVAAALAAGIDLVHATQMQGTLRRLGAM